MSVVVCVVRFGGARSVIPITEARSEGLIELKLVRKPPKVSRGYGGAARAATVASGTGSPKSGLPHRI